MGITPKKIHLNRDGSGRTASFSEVEFNSHAEAVIALRKKNAFIGKLVGFLLLAGFYSFLMFTSTKNIFSGLMLTCILHVSPENS